MSRVKRCNIRDAEWMDAFLGAVSASTLQFVFSRWHRPHVKQCGSPQAPWCCSKCASGDCCCTAWWSKVTRWISRVHTDGTCFTRSLIWPFHTFCVRDVTSAFPCPGSAKYAACCLCQATQLLLFAIFRYGESSKRGDKTFGDPLWIITHVWMGPHRWCFYVFMWGLIVYCVLTELHNICLNDVVSVLLRKSSRFIHMGIPRLCHWWGALDGGFRNARSSASQAVNNDTWPLPCAID